ncbi:hypothetical protein KCP74_18840 [Salmonella enterica subsp. enterica]|nr:hypothetical protein KCP74_18840 [Salmonella enterica subsp. enterica]
MSALLAKKSAGRHQRYSLVVFASRASYLDDADTVRPDKLQAAQLLTGTCLFVQNHPAHRGWEDKAHL